MKLTILALIFAAALTAGPLTIATQQAVWTNGLDTITIAPVTVEGPGVVSFSFAFESTSPASRTVEFSILQDATLGDSFVPIQIGYAGTYQLFPTGLVALSLAIAPTVVPVEADQVVKILSPDISAIAAPIPIQGTVPVRIVTDTPEPATFAFVAIGIMLLMAGSSRRRTAMLQARR